MHCVDNWNFMKRQVHVLGNLIPKPYLDHMKEILASFWGGGRQFSVSFFSHLQSSYKPLHSHHWKAEEGTLTLNHLISHIWVLTFWQDRCISFLFSLIPFHRFFSSLIPPGNNRLLRKKILTTALPTNHPSYFSHLFSLLSICSIMENV